MEFKYDDGGRSKYFKATNVGDCVTRAIANATGEDYKAVYDALNGLAKKERASKRKTTRSSSRNGVYTDTYRKYLEGELGWVWVPCMGIGSGCKTHLKDGELPSKGNLIVKTSKHLTCLKDGVLYDTYDCSRGGVRCVYGYWRAPNETEKKTHEDARKDIEDFQTFVKNEKERIAREREDVRKHNEAVKRKYAKRLRDARKKVRDIERLIAKETMPMPKMRDNAYAMRNAKEERQ